MSTPNAYHVLGPLEVTVEGEPQEISGNKLRRLLVLLVLESRRRLSDEQISSALWPESPPPTAAESLRVHVSRLRRALGEGVVVRDAGGYVLLADPETIDARAFESVVADARRLRKLDADAALARYREADALWRGSFACDVQFDRVPPEAQRLEELRLVAVEERLDVALASGDGPSLVPELEALVSIHPLRERFRAQLMLSLYAGGRQADALAAYRAARDSLRSELGIEPGPGLRDLERRILEQDPDLPGAEPARIARTHRRSRGVAAFGGAALVAAATLATAAGLTATGKHSVTPANVVPNSLVELDLATGDVRSVTKLPEGPDAIAVTPGALWVTSVVARTVARFDRKNHKVDVLGGVQAAGDITASPNGDVWVAGLRAEAVTLVNAARADFRDPRPSIAVPGGAISLEARDAAIWVTSARDEDGRGSLTRIDSRTRRRLGTTKIGVFPASVAVSSGTAWVANYGDGTVSKVDRAGRVMRTIPVGGGPITVVADGRSVWVGLFWQNEVVRIDPARAVVVARIPVGRGIWGMAVSDEAVWVANRDSSSLSRVDRRTNRVDQTVRLAAPPYGVGIADGRLWVTTQRCGSPNVRCAAA
jgi:DNA-binding SARP family transcriptional activator/DNA-binding beta-propeller fold protein YncE